MDISSTVQLWAYAGQLLQPAARELADTVTRYRDRRGESDLLRYIRLTSTNGDYMLYASRLAGNMMLALIFDAETPFGTIRSQASNLVRTLSNQSVVEQTTLDEALEDAEDADPEPAISFSDILTDIPAPNPPPDLGSPRARKEAPAEQPSETSQDTPIGSRIESGRLEYEEEESVKGTVDLEGSDLGRAGHHRHRDGIVRLEQMAVMRGSEVSSSSSI